MFMDIPPEVTKVLLHSFSDLLEHDFHTIIKYDPLDIPDGIPLLEVEDKVDKDKESDEDYEQRVLQNLDKDILVQQDQGGDDSDDSDNEEPGRTLRSRRVTFEK
jgi:hypothetical protein